jgi:Tol biopolymer transport system component
MSMDRARRLERNLPGLFDELADARTPDYLEDAIERASSNSQRPAWTFPARWLPMEIVTTRVPTTRLPWRQIGVLALIAIVLATVIAVVVGTRTTRLPEPFGPAANGVIALAQNGDLYTVDPDTGVMTLVLGGPESDMWVGFTPDGTQGVFVRKNSDAGYRRVGTVSLAGGQPTFVKKDVLTGGEPIQVAPNGRELAFAGANYYVGSTTYGAPAPSADWGANVINIGSLDANPDQRWFHTYNAPVADYGGLAYLAPEGREIVYVTRSSNGHTHDIRALEVATGLTRPIVETSVGSDIFGNVSAAPDGKRIAYALKSVTGTVSVHVVGADGTNDTVVGHLPGSNYEASPQWDPQGRRLLIQRDAGDGIVRPVIVDLGGRSDVVIDAAISDRGAATTWAPDGASILAERTGADGRPMQQELWDARTGKVTPVSWASVTQPAWQRTAP